MALLWQYQVKDQHYEVRSAGQTRRLYRNGVMHTSYHPGQRLSGSVWDLLFLPVLHHPRRRDALKVLVLGVGGGAVIRMLLHYFPQFVITGVEIDAVHLQIAEKYFGLTHKNLTLVEASGPDWLRQTRRSFDIIIEDMFIETDKEPVRLMDQEIDWLVTLNRHLKKDGQLIINHADSREAGWTVKQLKPTYCDKGQLSSWRTLLLQNKIICASLFTQTAFIRHLKTEPDLITRYYQGKLTFQRQAI